MDSSQLRPIQQQAIALLMQGKAQVEVAEILRVDRVTVGRWIQQPEFSNALSAEMAGVQEQVNQRLRESQTKALDTIEAILEADKSSDRTRLDAAKFILDRVRSLPQPPQPRHGAVPIDEVMAMMNRHEVIIDRQASLLFELMGLGAADDYLNMNDCERVLLAIACECFATYMETGQPWQPSPDDLLVNELRSLVQSHPEQLEAALRHIEQSHYATEAIAEIEGEKRDRQHPDPGGDVAPAVEA
jgi:hypothetical protein